VELEVTWLPSIGAGVMLLQVSVHGS
jgi:hypothetical protein